MEQSKPDAKQIVMGRELAEAFHAVGILPASYTKDGMTLNITRKDMVTLNVNIVVPLDKLREALDYIEERRRQTLLRFTSNTSSTSVEIEKVGA